jgi:hypothetical protein
MDRKSYESFADELKKIALDGQTRALLAAREGKEYLPGGQLPSNDVSETNFVPKIATKIKTPSIDEIFNKEKSKREKALKYKTKFHEGYSKVREPAAAAIKGGLLSSFLGSLVHGDRPKGWSLRRWGLAGAGVGLADYWAKGKTNPKTKTASPLGLSTMSTFSPARQLSRGRATGRLSNMVRKGDRLRPPTVGQKFSIPGSSLE